MRDKILAGVFLTICWYPVFASITVDLVCVGSTVVILKGEEVTKKPWSRTFSIKDGEEGVLDWKVSDTHLRYSLPPSRPTHTDTALLYESIGLTVEINRLSGEIEQIFTFKVSEKLTGAVGEYRYQIDRGNCSPAKKRF